MLALVVWEDLGFTIFGWIDWVLWAAYVLFTMLSVGKAAAEMMVADLLPADSGDTAGGPTRVPVGKWLVKLALLSWKRHRLALPSAAAAAPGGAP